MTLLDYLHVHLLLSAVSYIVFALTEKKGLSKSFENIAVVACLIIGPLILLKLIISILIPLRVTR